ncbi:tRNA (N(6)-L-threonylcarbamoyladenosine(37)-C(2))-methylthiotransferase MtaB [Miniphocaeibacter halophilus]|uniref:tRNA (N(6)-L-threonylcarbamoyladenosine(37)-C(2))-methylthiotransferase MtaB n=1 Tax=Miniphocaeibacter halophilus TaxID=2931922 RepID=A0AC61MPV5_9FIRM|nr:tRNA (N(6)-L-threonylcarbamoyladenosine(37)-C(2))-methylthiotransferase MtaB [Miniphocaeibacter halophilus]QQK07640.1 tRNA (N(6)-L-threonylcarbamoyladenosine(37)-C(2))-methylthiotransferase MtaB [Miniphocaeibacter halophilus]
MKKVSFLTLGCKVNQYETEAMMELFNNKGYKISENDEVCDIYVINTCTVTNLSDRKSRQFISKAKSKNPKAIIAAVGCYSQVSTEEVLAIDGINVILGTKNRSSIVEYCEEAIKTNSIVNKVEDIKNNKDFESLSITKQNHMTRAYIKIQEGCSQFCSYCIIPYARGPIRSRDLNEIYEEALLLSKNDFKEIILTGIHVASYGLDLKSNVSLVDVIEKIATINNIKRIRLSSLEPRIINDDFLSRVKNTNKFCDHFHLSLQSGSDKILKLMNRKYDTKEYLEKVELIRKYFPDAGITTDIIVGFPNETEEDFQDTLKFVNKVAFSKIHVFKYSPRSGTKASKMKNQVDGNIKKLRSSTLIEESKKLTNNFLKEFIGKDLEVLFEEKTDNKIISGYSTNYIRVSTNYNKEFINKIVKTKITDIQDEGVFGIIN